VLCPGLRARPATDAAWALSPTRLAPRRTAVQAAIVAIPQGSLAPERVLLSRSIVADSDAIRQSPGLREEFRAVPSLQLVVPTLPRGAPHPGFPPPRTRADAPQRLLPGALGYDVENHGKDHVGLELARQVLLVLGVLDRPRLEVVSRVTPLGCIRVKQAASGAFRRALLRLPNTGLSCKAGTIRRKSESSFSPAGKEATCLVL
jgi:hypothetical protein